MSKVYFNKKDKILILYNLVGDGYNHFTQTSFEEGFEIVLSGFHHFKCGKALFYNKEYKGSISDMTAFLELDWGPRAKLAGYFAGAMIESGDIFSSYSMDHYLQNRVNDGIKRRKFSDFEEGYKWLSTITKKE